MRLLSSVLAALAVSGALATPCVAGVFIDRQERVNEDPGQGQHNLDEKANPDVAYDHVTDRFLVVWERFPLSRSDHDVVANLVPARGANGGRGAAGPDIEIDGPGPDAQHPRVSFGVTAAGPRYLVVWDQDGGASGRDVMGQLLDAAGGLAGPAIALATSTEDEALPDVGFDAGTATWLVAWEVGGVDVRAQRVDLSGPTGTALAIGAGASATDFGAAVARHTLRDQARGVDAWVVAFTRQGASFFDVLAVAVDAPLSGTVSAEAAVMATGGPELLPRADAIPAATGNDLALVACNTFFGIPTSALNAVRLSGGTLTAVLSTPLDVFSLNVHRRPLPQVAARLALPPAGEPGYLVSFFDESAGQIVIVHDVRSVEVSVSATAVVAGPPRIANALTGAAGFFQHDGGPGAAFSAPGASGDDDAIVVFDMIRDQVKYDVYMRQWVPAVAAGSVDEGFESGTLAALPWRTGGAAPWTVSAVTPISGTFTAESGAIGTLATTFLELTMPTDGGILRFRRAVSTEGLFDVASFYLDGEVRGSWSGDEPVEEEVHRVAPGTRHYFFELVTDGSSQGGSNFFRIDDLDLPPLAPPTVTAIVASPASGEAPLTVSFAAVVTGVATAFEWDFGDPASGAANRATGPSPSHTFAAPGTYAVALRVTGPLGGAGTGTATVPVAPAGGRLGQGGGRGGGGGGGCALAAPRAAAAPPGSLAPSAPLVLLLGSLYLARRAARR